MKVKIFFLFLLIVSGDAYATAPSTIQQWLNELGRNDLLSTETEHGNVVSTNIIIEPTGEEGDDDGDDGGEAMASGEVEPKSSVFEWLAYSLPSSIYLLRMHNPVIMARVTSSFEKKITSTIWKLKEVAFKDCTFYDNGYAGPSGTCEWFFSQEPIGQVDISGDRKKVTINVSGTAKEREKTADGYVLQFTTHLLLLFYTYLEKPFSDMHECTVDKNDGILRSK